MNTTINKRTQKSATDYVNGHFDKNSRMQAIRLELGYTKEVSKDATLDDIKRDVKHMFNNARSKPSLFKEKIGHLIKYEEGDERGQHAHLLLLYDGHKVLKEAHLGDKIGQYWKENITQGKGTFHNCNREKSNYNRCGIGMIDHTDTQKRQHLVEDVLPYLTKTEQSISESKGTGRERSFTRGLMPKSKSNAGRPRMETGEENRRDTCFANDGSQDVKA